MGAQIKFNGGQPAAPALGSVFPLIIEVTGPDSYAAGGFLVDADSLGLSALAQVGILSCSGGLIAEYVKSTEKVILRFPTGGDPTSQAADDDPAVAGTVDIDSLAVGGAAVGNVPDGATPMTSTSADPAIAVPAAGLTVTGSGSVSMDALVAGVGIEPDDTTDCSAIIVTLLVIGRV